VITSDGICQNFLYRETEDQNFSKIFETDYKDRFYPISFDKDNKTLYASSSIGRDKIVIVKINPRTGKELDTIYQNPIYDVVGLYYSKIRGKPIYASYIDWKYRMEILDSNASKSFTYLQQQFPNFEIKVADMDSSETKFLLRLYNDRNWGYFYLYNRITKKLNKVADLSPWIPTEAMSLMKPIQFKSRDGILIQGYLTLPKQPQKNYPLLVNIHAGPFARDFWAFDREAQFFSNRGYAVLQINFRGSSGYGRKFYEASFKQWGKKIQDDITDGTRWAIAQGIADPSRIALYGYGFGGYCAIMGAIREPKLYSCVLSYAGFSNLFDYIKDVPPLQKVQAGRLFETIGDPNKDFYYIQEVSPLFHLNRLKIPIFIAQGGKDNRVRVEETDYFVKELKKNGVKVTYLVKPEEGRFFTKEEDKLDLYASIEKFLAQNIQKP
jgi:dipeptidyl aminopeptidase/acylaminoacyl peptidase